MPASPTLAARILSKVRDSDQRRKRVHGLASAIVKHIRDHRRAFTLTDGLKAGFNTSELARFWDDALVEARRIEPGIDEMAIHP